MVNKIIRKRILVGDDDFVNPSEQRMFQRQFQDELVGTVCDFTGDPDEYVRMAREGQYDCLITDLNWMREDFHREHKTGYRILEKIRDYAPVRALWTTDEGAKDRAFANGATHYISKHDRAAMNSAIHYLEGDEEK